MKKFITAIAIALVAASAFAQSASWIGNSYIVANGTWYNASGEGNPDFNAADLGDIFELTLAGQIQSYGDDDGANNPAFINYKFDDGTAYSAQLDWFQYENNNNWFGTSDGTVGAFAADGFAALDEGKHTIAVWFSKPSTDDSAYEGNIYDSNGGNNYVANFTKVASPAAVPEPATMSLLGLGALAMVIRRKLRK